MRCVDCPLLSQTFLLRLTWKYHGSLFVRLWRKRRARRPWYAFLLYLLGFPMVLNYHILSTLAKSFSNLHFHFLAFPTQNFIGLVYAPTQSSSSPTESCLQIPEILWVTHALTSDLEPWQRRVLVVLPPALLWSHSFHFEIATDYLYFKFSLFWQPWKSRYLSMMVAITSSLSSTSNSYLIVTPIHKYSHQLQ